MKANIHLLSESIRKEKLNELKKKGRWKILIFKSHCSLTYFIEDIFYFLLFIILRLYG